MRCSLAKVKTAKEDKNQRFHDIEAILNCLRRHFPPLYTVDKPSSSTTSLPLPYKSDETIVYHSSMHLY
jgi:hypothetical protein